MEIVLGRTTKGDQKIAISSVSKIRKSSLKSRRGAGGFAKIKIHENGEYLRIPKKALGLLFTILENMAEGKSITLVPSETEISTQQAAEMLNVSRPHLVKILENGKIPFKKVGSHRRIGLKHLIEYEKKLKENQKKKLALLAEQAQELNLGY